MIIFYIKMKIRAGGGALGQEGGALGQQGAPPCYSSLWETLENLPIRALFLRCASFNMFKKDCFQNSRGI